MHTEPVIDNLHVVSIINNNVLKLKVTVADFLTVQIAYTLSYLSEKVNHHVFRQDSFRALVLDILIETNSGYVFLNYIDLLRGFKRIEKFDCVRVLKLFHAVDFTHYRFLLARIVQLVLRIDFHSDFLFRRLLGG